VLSLIELGTTDKVLGAQHLAVDIAVSFDAVRSSHISLGTTLKSLIARRFLVWEL
jgi:hypothetical protein